MRNTINPFDYLFRIIGGWCDVLWFGAEDDHHLNIGL